ncbi:abscisic acid 8'-hydroxylase 3-like [Zingiber officinale]|uniref:abscisic acid 8'-hydroxylase 3-like n=1 Tax=Zingiber officinale TaxID=94328 RepID=UPI001C4DCAE1|nr:abscisic acid 8'-hydroxylase 3-like [Zingiber officinale]
MACAVACTLLIGLAVTYVLVRISKHKISKEPHRRRRQLKLPPGSMGWPYIGETLQLYSQDPNLFFATRQKRYGEIFKTRLLGCPCVMLASPEAAKFVLVTQAHLFKPTYPRSKERLIGPWALFFHQGDYHLRLRKIVQAAVSPDALRGIVPDVERLVVPLLRSWDGREFSTFHTMKQLPFDAGVLVIFGGQLEDRHRSELKKNFFIVEKGYNSFPNSFPRTTYHKAIQARKRLGGILAEIMNERRKLGSPAKSNDLLSRLMNSEERLSDDQIADNVIGVLFAAQDTTASVMTWILKFLHDDPKLLQAVKDEQMAIWDTNEQGRRPLTWAQIRSMILTHKVILESLRMASIISFTFREAVDDVEYKGYLIPKGWKVMPLFRNIHHNSEFFREPQIFNPSRFEVAPKPNTFFPFGTGIHACPGNELAKLEILVLIHHLVTNYRWEIMGQQGGEVECCPFPVPKQGLVVKLWRVSDSSRAEQSS